jgi:putative hydrolase of the HAD superfamily
VDISEATLVSVFDTIILDLDGTLIDERANVDSAFLAAGSYAHDHYDIDPDAFARVAADTAQQVWWQPDWLGPLTKRYGLSYWDALSESFAGPSVDLDRVRAWLPHYRRTSWTKVYAAFGFPASSELAEQTAQVFRDARHTGRLTPLAGAADLLDWYADRRLVIVTNGCAHGQQRKADTCGLGRKVDALVASTAIGAGKPDSAVVRAALAAVGSTCGRAVVVGDSFEHDIRAAINCGLPSIWVGGPPQPGAAVPAMVTIVAEIGEVAAAIARLEQSPTGNGVPAGAGSDEDQVG